MTTEELKFEAVNELKVLNSALQQAIDSVRRLNAFKKEGLDLDDPEAVSADPKLQAVMDLCVRSSDLMDELTTMG